MWTGRRCVERAREHLRRFGPFAFVVGRFFATVRILAAAVAASAGIRYHQFLVYDAAGALLWSAAFVLARRVLGAHAPELVERVGMAGRAAALMLAALAVAVGLALRRRRRAP